MGKQVHFIKNKISLANKTNIRNVIVTVAMENNIENIGSVV